MAILSKECKPDKFVSHNSLKRSLTNIRDLRSSFVECEYFLNSNSPDILALCKTNFDDLIDPCNFSVTVHMHGLAIYVKEGLPFERDVSLENSVDSCCMIFPSPFLDVTRMPMPTVSFLLQLDSGILCL